MSYREDRQRETQKLLSEASERMNVAWREYKYAVAAYHGVLLDWFEARSYFQHGDKIRIYTRGNYFDALYEGLGVNIDGEPSIRHQRFGSKGKLLKGYRHIELSKVIKIDIVDEGDAKG